MFGMVAFLYIFFFCASLVIIINALIFMRGRILWAVLFHFISVIFLLSSGIFAVYPELPPEFQRAVFLSGFILYPFSLSLLVKTLIFPRERLSIKFFFFFIPPALVLIFIIPEYSSLVKFFIILSGIFYLAANFSFPSGGRIALFSTVVSFSGLAVSSIFILAGFTEWFILIAAALSSLLFIVISLSFRLKIDAAFNQIKLFVDMNNRLAHNVLRYRQSNEECRKIIVDRELELFQMARHASLAELTTGIAHELSQPLTGIKAISQNMIDDINYDDFDPLQAVAELTRIAFLVDKASSIIDHIRNFSRKKNFSMKKNDLNNIIMDAIELIRIQIKKNNIEMVFILDEKIPEIIGDAISLEQLIVNMILNSKDAIVEKYSSGREKNGVITISTYSKDNGVVFSIEDNGMGMSEDVIQKIWSPFFTTKKKDYGTGIGLSLSKKILNEHRAVVEVNSQRGAGTSFTVFFPPAENQNYLPVGSSS